LQAPAGFGDGYTVASTAHKELNIFVGLCETLRSDDLRALRAQVAAYLLQLEQQQSRSELIALDLAVLLTDRLDRLCELAPELSDEQQALVVGAARYFISQDDAIPDTRACTGLDDDVRIVNHVLRQLGRTEWLIEE